MRTFNLELTLPKGWHELDDGQLILVFQLLAQGLSSDQIKTACLMQGSDMKLLYMDGGTATLQKGEDTFCLTSHQLLQQLAGVLYPGYRGTLAKWQEVAVFYWMVSLKEWLSHRFSDFFRSLADQSGNLLGDARPLGLRIQQSVDAMLRALTKGDVTKE